MGNSRKVVATVAVVFACASLPGCSGTPAQSDAILTGEVFSVSCERAWADCYAEAQRRCVGGNYEEIDRNSLQRTTTDNQSFEQSNAQSQSTYRAVTIRCK